MIEFLFFAFRSAYRRRLAAKNTPRYLFISYTFDRFLLLHFEATCEPTYAGIHYGHIFSSFLNITVTHITSDNNVFL